MKYCSVQMSVLLLTVGGWCLSLHDQAAREALPKVACFNRRIRAVFGPLVGTNLHVKDTSGAKIPVPEDEGPCGVRKSREKHGGVSFYSQYDSCYVQIQGSSFLVPLAVQLAGDDRWIGVNISCLLIKRHAGPPQPTPMLLPGKCDLVPTLRMPCGPLAVSMKACWGLGCCFNSQEAVCYYRLNACSMDGHFVFSVEATDTEPRLDPRTLGVRGHPDCLPGVATGDIAIFKIPTTECGARLKLQGDVLTYEVEVESLQTDHSPFSLQVQCEYEGPGVQPVAAVRSASIIATPAPLVAMGTIGVQMKIATDSSFSSFIGADQLPAAFPLRSPVYVEVSIRQPAPEPGLSLRVRDCFAYPASRTSVWTLLYDGCPNLLDPLRSSSPVDSQGGASSPSQVRRFDVKTFAFLDPQTGKPSAEEIYFYCWVEICTVEAECAQQCTIVCWTEEEEEEEGGLVRPGPAGLAGTTAVGMQ
ncbi:unnamed protein product [Lota lota]